MTRALLAALLLCGITAGCSESMPTAPSTISQSSNGAPPPPTPAPAPPPAPAPQTARYEVVFESIWTSGSHPSDFPSDAHFSGLVGGTHAPAAVFWREGSLASEGIRAMAERGSKSPLTEEVQSAIAAGAAEHVLSGDALGRSPGSVRMEFDISQGFPLVSLVTMVAPSPDWFVGISALPLFADGDWVSERQVTLVAFDAGTDSGVTYKSLDQETVPRQPVRRISGFPLIYNGAVAPIGTFTFRRIGGQVLN